MKYTVPLLCLLIVLCIGWAHAAPPEGSCIMDLETCKNYDGGTIYLISDLPYSEDLMVGWHDYDASNPSYRALPAPYSDYSGYVLGVTPGDNSLIITKPGYQPLTLSYHICDCKYTFVSFTLKKTPPVIKPGSANFPAAIFTTLPKLDKPTLVAKVTTTAAAQGSGSKIGVSGSQNFGAAAGALSDSTQDGSSSGNQQTGSSQTGSSSGNQQTGSGSGSQQPGTTATGGADTANTGALSVTTTPAGVSIFIDGVQRGRLPCNHPRSRAGRPYPAPETGRVHRSLHTGLDYGRQNNGVHNRTCNGREVAGVRGSFRVHCTRCDLLYPEDAVRITFFLARVPVHRTRPAGLSSSRA